VVKVPRFTFEKFPQTPPVLTTSMKSVGEAMAIGRTFKEALQKALRSLETGRAGLDDLPPPPSEEHLRRALTTPGPERVFYIKQAYQQGLTTDDLYHLTMIDPWFLDNIQQIVQFEGALAAAGLATACPPVGGASPWRAGRGNGGLEALSQEQMFEAKRHGFSDVQLARLLATTETAVRDRRRALGVRPAFKSVDTCAAEFEAFTPYYYSTYEKEDETHRG
jgi:carbamoyl-phosphate synthase large subunit